MEDSLDYMIGMSLFSLQWDVAAFDKPFYKFQIQLSFLFNVKVMFCNCQKAATLVPLPNPVNSRRALEKGLWTDMSILLILAHW